MEYLVLGLIWFSALVAGLFLLAIAWRFMQAHEKLAQEVYEIRVLCRKLVEESLVAKRLAADQASETR